MAKIYERLLSTIIPHGKSKNLSADDCTWMVDRLEIPRIIFYLCVYSIYTTIKT